MRRSAELEGAGRLMPCSNRTRGWIGLVAIALLAASLLPDIGALLSQPLPLRTTGNDYMTILAAERRNQIVNFVIGAALHEGVGKVKKLVIPRDLQSLSARPTDTMLGGVRSAMQRRLLAQLAGGQLADVTYDPRVSEATIAAWSASGRLTTYPHEVLLLRPKAQASSGTWVLLTDSSRLRIFVVPVVDAPAGVQLP